MGRSQTALSFLRARLCSALIAGFFKTISYQHSIFEESLLSDLFLSHYFSTTCL